jgi:NAD(P)-dependent dehydrogenase (short-subunit alcohol dehydrogenase family)
MAPLEEHPFDEWQSVLDVNLTGVFLTAREASRQMIDTGEGGTIVSTASIYGAVGSFAGTSTRPCQDSKHRSLSVQVGSDSIISQPANFGQIFFGIQSCDGARRVLRVLLVQSNFGVRLLTLKLI